MQLLIMEKAWLPGLFVIHYPSTMPGGHLPYPHPDMPDQFPG